MAAGARVPQRVVRAGEVVDPWCILHYFRIKCYVVSPLRRAVGKEVSGHHLGSVVEEESNSKDTQLSIGRWGRRCGCQL